MGSKPIGIEEFAEMFDLDGEIGGEENEQSEQSEEYKNNVSSNDTFDNLAEEISDSIEDLSDDGASLVKKESPHDIVNDVMSGDEDDFMTEEYKEGEKKLGEKEIDDEISKSIEDQSDIEEKNTDTLIEIDDDIEINGEDIEVVEEKQEEIRGESKEEDILKEVSIVNDEIQWVLDSPSAMYDKFYNKKKELINTFMIGGQVKYSQWMSELADASVNIQGEVFDQSIIMGQMQCVQQFRERVKYISIKVNNQYYMFKRYVELMRGFLARVEYLKPIIKQDGLILEHMRDLELYLTRLESLHDSVIKTEKTLLAAFDTLSRKVTICMELRPSERFEKREVFSPTMFEDKKINNNDNVIKKVNQYDLEDYDDLPKNVSNVDKVGEIGWGDI